MDIAKTKSNTETDALREAENTTTGFQRVVEQIAKQVGGHSHASSIFGEPVTRDGVTVIPVARVVAAFGAGVGRGTDAEGENATDTRGVQGMGGGGGFLVTPVGMIEIREDGARFRRLDNQPELGVWSDVAELVLMTARRGLVRLARSLKKKG